MSRTLVHLLRHGEVHNPDGTLYGRLPGYHLATGGRDMAVRVAEHLGGRDIVYIASSPLERALETAEPIAWAFSLEVTIDLRLIEAANQFEGSRFGVGDGALKRPANWWKLRNPARPSWGEPCHISCRSGRCGGSWSGGTCGMTRGGGNAGWPR